MLPFGAVTVTGRAAPALKGMSGLVSTHFTQDREAETVAAKGRSGCAAPDPPCR